MIGTKVKRRVSNSSLDWVKLGPRVFKMMWDRELVKTSTESLDLGSAIHCYILEPDKFRSDYIIMDSSVKPVEGLMGNFIRAMHKIEISLLPGELPTEDVYQNVANAVGFKLKLPKIMELYNDPKYDSYKEALRQAHGLSVLSTEDAEILKACLNSISKHKLASLLLLTSNSNNSFNEVMYEGTIKAAYKDIEVVGIMDRLIFDHENKTITLVDLKTTSNSVYLFHESYRKYQYDRQMAFYHDMLKADYPDYTIDVYIVAVQTTYLYNYTTDCAVYKIYEADILAGRDKYKRLLDVVSWHMKNDIWDYPQEYHESIGLCRINQNP